MKRKGSRKESEAQRVTIIIYFICCLTKSWIERIQLVITRQCGNTEL